MPQTMSQTWRLTVAYDGGGFSGWQVQPGRETVQGELAAAVERITGERILPQGSGRTDAGVHALGQVASFSLTAPIPEAAFRGALNRILPASIRVLGCEHAPVGFHARHSARAKTYEYRIYRGEICPPTLARYVYAFPHPLDQAAMNEAAVRLAGSHDFTSFAAADPDRARREPTEAATEIKRDNIRTIRLSEWTADGDILRYRVTGDGFLHHMVRNLVGTLLDAGRGRTRPENIPSILEAHSRQSAGPTAPARGLFLISVEYEEQG